METIEAQWQICWTFKDTSKKPYWSGWIANPVIALRYYNSQSIRPEFLDVWVEERTVIYGDKRVISPEEIPVLSERVK